MVLLGGTLWGTSGVAGQYILQDCGFDVGWLTTSRLIISGLLLLIIDKIMTRKSLFEVWRKKNDAIDLLLFGTLGLGAVQYTYYAVISRSNAATGTVLQYLMPAIIVLWYAFKSRRLPKPVEALCVLLAMAGTFFLVTHGSIETLAISPAALFWGLSSALAAAYYTVKPKRLIGEWRATLIVGWGMLSSGLLLAPFYPPWDFVGRFDLYAALTYFYIIIFGTVIAFGSYLGSLRYIKPSETGVLASIEPVSAIVFSILCLGVPLTGMDIFGAALILSSVIILAKKS